LASATGAWVTAVSASTERGQRLLALGAAEVVQSPADAEAPYDVAFESVGGSTLPQVLKLLAKGGRLMWLGQASRTSAIPDGGELSAKQQLDAWEVNVVGALSAVAHLAPHMAQLESSRYWRFLRSSGARISISKDTSAARNTARRTFGRVVSQARLLSCLVLCGACGF
jgi:NADPH:quinone reductase-like Zn-dependent oxidoreductase